MVASDQMLTGGSARPRIAAWIEALYLRSTRRLLGLPHRHRQLIARPGDPDLTWRDAYLAGRDDRPYSLARARARQAELLARQSVVADTPLGPIRLANFGRRSTSRAASLLTKEPGTIAWIDAMPADAVLWDVGANIGVYSLYAAKRGLHVVAIEPAAVNFWLLCANVELNGLCDRIMTVPFGLENRDGFEPLYASQFQPAMAPGFLRRKPCVPPQARQNAPILQAGSLLSLGAEFPNHVKIDVLSVTQRILDGLKPLLGDPRLRSIQIEVGRGTAGGRRCADRLVPYGFSPCPESQKPAGAGSPNWIFRRGP